MNKDERWKIFKRVFRIKTVHDKRNKDGITPNKKRKDWYDKRNEIAHGRNEETMTLREYGDVEVFVTNSMLDMAEQCKAKLKLEV